MIASRQVWNSEYQINVFELVRLDNTTLADTEELYIIVQDKSHLINSKTGIFS